MDLSTDSCRDFFLYPFSYKTNLNTDFSNKSHKYLVEKLDAYLRYQTLILPNTAQVGTTHGSSEQGIDLLTNLYGVKLKIGWQIKSWSDLQQKTVVDHVLAQVHKSMAHRLDLLVIILAGDPEKHSGKISTIISQLSLTSTNKKKIHIIQPTEFANILDEKNWNLMRTRGVSRLMQIIEVREPGPISMMPDPGPLNPVIVNNNPAIFHNHRAEQLYNNSLFAIKSGDIISAEKLAMDAHGIESTADTMNLLGNIHLIKGEFKEAVEYYEGSIRANPQKETSTGNLIITLLRVGLFDEAEALLIQELDKRKSDLDLTFLYAKLLTRKGMGLKAYRMLKEKESAITLNGTHLLEFANQAYTYKDYETALSYYSQFITLYPKDARGPWGEALTYEKMGNLENALDSINKAVEISPNTPEIRSIQACCLRDLGRIDEALVIFELARSIAPSAIHIIGNLANLLRDIGRPLEALEYYDQLMRYYPYDQLLWENRGKALFNMSFFNDAYISKMIAVKVAKDPSAELIHDAGLAAMKAGRESDAIRLFNESIEKKAQLWHPKYNLAILSMKYRFYDKAIILLNECIAIGHDTAPTRTLLASCFIQQKQYDEARKEIEKALTLDPNFPPAIGTLGLIKKNDGSDKEALKLFDRALSMDNSLDFVNEALMKLKEKRI